MRRSRGRGRISLLLGLPFPACAYVPAQATIPAASRDAVREAVVEALTREFRGIADRNLASGRFVSAAVPDPLDPRARWRGFVRILPGGEPASESWTVEVTVARETFRPNGARPAGWRMDEVDSDRSERLGREIARLSARRARFGP